MNLEIFDNQLFWLLEEPKELIVRRSSGLESHRLPARIDGTWARLKRFVHTDTSDYCIVPRKISCVFK